MNESEKSIRTAVLYARPLVNIDVPSVDRQIEDMIEWCASNDTSVLRIIADCEPCNSTRYDEMLGFLARVHPDVVLMWSAGVVCDELEFVMLQNSCKAHGCVIRFVTSRAKPESDTGRLITSIDLWNARFTSLLAQKVIQ